MRANQEQFPASPVILVRFVCNMLVDCAVDSNTRERTDARSFWLPVARPKDLRQLHITFLYVYIIKIILG
jgi:hypothetical protein